MEALIFIVPAVIAILLMVYVLFIGITQSFSIIGEDQRVVVLRFGKYLKYAGPGIVFLIPFIDSAKKIKLEAHIPNWLGERESDIESRAKEIIFQQLEENAKTLTLSFKGIQIEPKNKT